MIPVLQREPQHENCPAAWPRRLKRLAQPKQNYCAFEWSVSKWIRVQLSLRLNIKEKRPGLWHWQLERNHSLHREWQTKQAAADSGHLCTEISPEDQDHSIGVAVLFAFPESQWAAHTVASYPNPQQVSQLTHASVTSQTGVPSTHPDHSGLCQRPGLA